MKKKTKKQLKIVIHHRQKQNRKMMHNFTTHLHYYINDEDIPEKWETEYITSINTNKQIRMY